MSTPDLNLRPWLDRAPEFAEAIGRERLNANTWDHQLWRLGDTLVVRMPRHPHHRFRRGRVDIGWDNTPEEGARA